MRTRCRQAPEPKGTLGIVTSALAGSFAAPPAVVMNGPEDHSDDWASIDWRQVEDDVRRLRQRIFTAAREQDLRKVRSLQKLMLRSRSNALVSVRRVTEINAGRMTAGVDGAVAVSDTQKAELADVVRGVTSRLTPLPVRRVFIPQGRGDATPARHSGDR